MKEKVTILLVEDDQFLLEGMQDLLHARDIGYELHTLTAKNGVKGLEVMESVTPDLIISDIMMPQMDGLEFLQHVRERNIGRYIPFIFLTARGEAEDIHEGKVQGADRYITKPFRNQELLETIKSQLDRAFDLRRIQDDHFDSLKKNILQMLTHEFNTPLTYVTAYTEMLSQENIHLANLDSFREYLRGIQVGTVRLTKLIRDFIQVIDMRTGELQTRFLAQAEKIEDVRTAVYNAINDTPNPKNIPLDCLFTTKPAVPVWGSVELLTELFSHLLSNALKFTSHTPNQQGQVTISLETTENMVHVHIKDNGIGFPQHVTQDIFQPFYQYNRQRIEQQGAGVGLTIVDGLTKLHNGQITVTSEEEQGSTFTITLPIFQGQPPHPPEPEDTLKKIAKILVVEDDYHLLVGLQEILEIFETKYDFHVTTAENGQEGLDILQTFKPDLIISDIMMPIIGGYEFLEKVRANPALAEIPFTFLTARSEKEDIHRGLNQGVEEYITKPYDSKQLVALVVTQLDKYFERKNSVGQGFDDLKQSILGLITPDFITPLTNVTKHSTQLTQEIQTINNEKELKESLSSIQVGSQRLNQLVVDFISLAELKTGESETSYQIMSDPIGDFGLMVCECMQQLAFKHTLQINCQINTDLPTIFGARYLLITSIERLILTINRCVSEAYQLNVSSQCNEEYVQLLMQWEPISLSPTLFEQIQSYLGETRDDILWEHAPSLQIIRGQVLLHNGRFRIAQSHNTGLLIGIEFPIHQPNQGASTYK